MKKLRFGHVMAAVIIACFVAMVALVTVFPSKAVPPDEIIAHIAAALLAIAWYLVLVTFLACLAYFFLSLLNKNVIKLRILEWCKKMDDRGLLIYAKRTALYLQAFLYGILEQNKDTLSLPVGNDISCLLAPGSGFQTRKNSVFYRFSLLLPEKPDMDRRTMEQLLRGYVWTELSQYGIPGLYSVFQSKNHGVLPSVYIDRLLYNEKQHTLLIDLLYICTEESATYAVEAHKRNCAETAPTVDVFDDDVG